MSLAFYCITMIKVLREGVHGNNYYQGYTNYEPICSSTTLIQTGGKNILVDPGHIALNKELISLLAKEGVRPNDIDYVFLTHHHLDHSSNMGSFFGAKIFIGGGYIDHAAPSYMVYDDLSLFKLPASFSIVKTPGHTAESMSYFYEEKGVRYVCAGDAVREDILREGMLRGMENLEMAQESVKKIFSLGDVIIPGHGRVIQDDVKKELQKLVDKL